MKPSDSWDIIDRQLEAAINHCKSAVKNQGDPFKVSLEAGLALENIETAVKRIFYLRNGRWP